MSRPYLKKEKAFLPLLSRPDGLNESVFENADEIGPEEGDGEDGEQPFYPLDVGEMGVLHVEAAGLQGFEARLDLPAHFIGVDGLLGLVERQEYLEFGLALAVLHPCGGEVTVLVVDEVDAWKVLGLALLESLEHPEGRCAGCAPRSSRGCVYGSVCGCR